MKGISLAVFLHVISMALVFPALSCPRVECTPPTDSPIDIDKI